ncbi:PatA/PatG family cyanobactin maturation protease [Labrys wisconsinensis]|uniref:Cyanobactin maturation PatA/PatG family protease n=1 Tax=Labrys wisconsinensis TaxID=425677 RepID=A0ABU0JMR5_9HYPH|nr:PatA/PatG family cyanobactin maturation protease [Labrys wisconsinensis]MDQ0474811.1 cyanobactin maturation PatA/PatG family protease [Labrys wisconsinensis]
MATLASTLEDDVRALGKGDARICIAILDGPTDLSHPCFAGAKITELTSLIECGDLNGPATQHGTHVSSIIFGQPSTLINGIAPSCRGLSIPIFSDEMHNDKLSCSQLDLARAILLAVEGGANIINISGGQLTNSEEPEPFLAQAINICARHNILIVAAAGNDGCECIHIPAASPSVLSVGAMDHDGRPLASSNWGPAYQRQGLLALGANIPGAMPGGGITRRSGTSFAAPIVSGVAALLASRQVQSGQTLDPHGIRAFLLKGAEPCIGGTEENCRQFLSGRLNVKRAINLMETRGTSMSETSRSSLTRDIIPESGQTVDESITFGAKHSSAQSTPADCDLRVSSVAAPIKNLVGQVIMSDCGCGGGDKCTCGGGDTCTCGGGTKPKTPQLVYALGKIGYDLISEARRDSFVQAPQGPANPFDQTQMLAYLNSNPSDAQSIIWTLNLDATPIYAIQPMGPWATDGYARLREFLHGQLNEGVEIVSIPGVIGGSVRLQSGQVVPVIIPALRGMYSWATKPLVSHILGEAPKAADALRAYNEQAVGLSDFLNRVYYDLRNLGVTAEERALNYSATNAIQIRDVIIATTQQELDLDDIKVKRSPVCRPESDCYDIEMGFYSPDNMNKANRIFRFAVDVSDIIPVTIDSVRSWTKRV